MLIIPLTEVTLVGSHLSKSEEEAIERELHSMHVKFEIYTYVCNRSWSAPDYGVEFTIEGPRSKAYVLKLLREQAPTLSKIAEKYH